MNLDFSKLNGLIPCIVQDINTQKVLMLGFMNEEAYHKTLTEKKVTFFSRSKNRLWTKGETSGNLQEIVRIHFDCDADSLLFLVQSHGPACHTGERTCFYREMENSP